jgi:hypothetical protein
MAGNWGGFLSSIGVPRGTAGYLDWTTGLMRVNTPHDTWVRIARTPDLRTLHRWEQEVVETVTHEAIHFLQIVTTGYLYDFASTLFALVRSAIGFPVRDVSDIPSHATPELAARLRSHFANLDAAGPEGITVRGLAEGQAMLAQLRTHWRSLTADEYPRRLADLPSEYSHAYLFSQKILGAAAFEIYPFVSSMALCTRSPVTSFVTMCHAIKARGISVILPSESPHEYLELANELHHGGEIALLGTSVEIFNDRPIHPVYSPMVARLNELAAVASMLEYMAVPHRVARPIAEAVARPAVYNRDAEGNSYIHIPDNWRPDLDRKTREDEAAALVLLMASSTRILKSL